MRNSKATPINRAKILKYLLWLPIFMPILITAGEKAKLHSPKEIIELMEKSELTYRIGTLKEGKLQPTEKPRQLSYQLYLEKSETGLLVGEYELSPEAKQLFQKGQEFSASKDYEAALKQYQELNKLMPKYSVSLVLIGDMYYNLKKFDQAEEMFKKAIELNYISYNAHWFFADTEWELGNKETAMQEITIAHLLNVGHESLRKKMLSCRRVLNRDWKDWDYLPQYQLSQKGKEVSVDTDIEWMGYAIAKAIWKYEPNYAEKMSGKEYVNQVVDFSEEKEALISALASNGDNGKNIRWTQIKQIVSDGYVNEFILYEIVGRKAPLALVLLPREQFMRLVTYVNTYH
jgi:tetratricopeptide (TPR) repeat protein